MFFFACCCHNGTDYLQRNWEKSTSKQSTISSLVQLRWPYATSLFTSHSQNPLEVLNHTKYLSHNSFMDYSNLQYYSQICPVTKVADECVTDLMVFRYSHTHEIQYKINYDAPFQDLQWQAKKSQVGNHEPPQFCSQLKTNRKKYQHLQDLTRVIPMNYYGFMTLTTHGCMRLQNPASVVMQMQVFASSFQVFFLTDYIN